MAMMTTIRDRSHVFLWALLILFVISMSIGGLVGGANIIDQLFGRVNPAEAIGSVNGNKITPDQFNQAVSARLQNLQSSGAKVSDQYLELIREQVWNAFIEERLTEEAIASLDIDVNDDEILYHLENNPPIDVQRIFYKNNIFDKDSYLQALNTPGMMDWSPIESWMRNFYIPRFKLQQHINLSAIVSKGDIENEFTTRTTDYTISAINITNRAVEGIAEKPSEQELVDNYKSKLTDFKKAEARHMSFVAWKKLSSTADSIRIKKEAKEIIKSYKNGTDFSSLANIHTEDEGNRVSPDSGKGGDLGWFEKGQMTPPFEKAAFKARKGSVVGPVLSQFGYHIIKVDSIKNRGKSNHKIKARHILLKINIGQNTRTELRRKSTLFSFDAQDYGFESAIDTHKIEIQSATDIGEKDIFINGIGAFRSGVRWAYNSKIKAVSDPMETENYYAVFRLDSIIPAGTASFEDSRSQVYAFLNSIKKNDATKKLASELRDQVLNGQTFKKINNENKRIEFISSDKKKLSTPFSLLGKSDELIGALLAAKEGDLIGPIKTLRGHCLVKVKVISNFDSTAWKIQKNIIQSDLQRDMERSTYQNWLSDLKDKSDIIDNRNYHF